MNRSPLIEEQLTQSVIGAFFEVYNALGFGFLEYVYVRAMERELQSRGHCVAREVAVRVTYKGEYLATQRIDMIVDNKLVVEAKSAPRPHGHTIRQLYNYLRGTDLEVGLILHFGPSRNSIDRSLQKNGSTDKRIRNLKTD